MYIYSVIPIHYHEIRIDEKKVQFLNNWDWGKNFGFSTQFWFSVDVHGTFYPEEGDISSWRQGDSLSFEYLGENNYWVTNRRAGNTVKASYREKVPIEPQPVRHGQDWEGL